VIMAIRWKKFEFGAVFPSFIFTIKSNLLNWDFHVIRNVHFLAISSRIQKVRFNNKKARRGHSHFQYRVTVVTDKSTVVTETVLLKILKIRGVINKDIYNTIA
jgi:hypothetical protein